MTAVILTIIGLVLWLCFMALGFVLIKLAHELITEK